MPQGEETFLYRIVTQLDDEEAFSQVSQELSLIADKTEQAGGKIQNLTSELAKMLPKSNLGAVQEKLQQISGPTDIEGLKIIREDLERLQQEAKDGSAASKRLAKVLDAVDSADFQALSKHVSALQDEINDTSTPLLEIQQQIDRVAQADGIEQAEEAFQSLRKTILQNERAIENMEGEANFDAMTQRVARLEDTFQDTRNSVAMAGSGIEKKLGTSLDGVNTQVDRTRLKTNQMSQAILQGAQDAQFGVIGVANNIQMLGESISRQMNKGVSGFRLLSDTLSNLFMGPMAIGTLITAITLLAQNFDKLPESVKSFADPLLKSLGLINTEFENLNEEVEKLIKKKSDDFSQLLKEAEGEQADLARDRLKTLRQSLQVSLKQLKARRDAITRETDIFKIRQRLVDNSKEITAESFSQIENAKTRKKIKQQANRILQRRKGLEDSIESSIQNRQQQIKKTGERLRILNAEEIALDKTVSRVADKFQWTRDRAREWVKNVREGKEETGGGDENAEDLLSTWQLLSKEVRSFVKEQEDITFDPTITFGSGQTNFDAYRKKLGLESQNILPPFARMKETIERRVEATGEVIESEADFDKELPDLMVIPGQGVITQKKFKEQQKEAQQIYKEEMAEFSAKQRQFQLETQRESPGESLGLFPGTSLQKEKELAQERLQIKLDHIKKVGNVEEGELQTTENLTEKEIQLWKNKEQRKTEIQRKFANKRTALQFQETQKIADQLTQNNPIARGTSQLITRLGATWDAFYNDRIEWEKMTTRKQAETVSRMGSQIVGAASNIASGVFDTWKQKRAQELKQQGKDAEERRKILKKEGKKRFQIMKALQIAEASANVAKGVTQALALPFPLNWAQAAAVSAAGAFRINQIAGLSIGDKLGGGSGGGSGQSSANLTGEFTQLTPDRNARRANNLANASRRSQATQRRSEADKMERAAQKMDSAARKIQKTEVTYDDKTAEDITERGRTRQESLNI